MPLLTRLVRPEKDIDIYVGLTEIRRKWYRSVPEKNIGAVNGMLARLV